MGTESKTAKMCAARVVRFGREEVGVLDYVSELGCKAKKRRAFPLLFTEMWSEHELEFGISKIGTVKRKLPEIARAPVGRTDALVVRTSCGAKRPPVYDPSRSDYKPMLVRPLFRHAIPTILGFGDPPNSNWGSLHSI